MVTLRYIHRKRIGCYLRAGEGGKQGLENRGDLSQRTHVVSEMCISHALARISYTTTLIVIKGWHVPVAGRADPDPRLPIEIAICSEQKYTIK